MILCYNTCSSDEDITEAGNILKEQFQQFHNFQSTLGSHDFVDGNIDRNIYRYENEPSLHLHNVDGNHWVLSSSLGSSKDNISMIAIFDSLRGPVMRPHLQKQINRIYTPDESEINSVIVDVQQQANSIDCGVYAIAYAVDLLFGFDPSVIEYDERALRPHLVKCFENQWFIPFPGGYINNFENVSRANLASVDESKEPETLHDFYLCSDKWGALNLTKLGQTARDLLHLNKETFLCVDGEDKNFFNVMLNPLEGTI